MTAHIHRDCIVAYAEDTTRTVKFWRENEKVWAHAAGSPRWFPINRYRVLDADGNVIAETPAPKPRRVRIPACTLPAPLESAEGYELIWTGGTLEVQSLHPELCLPEILPIRYWATKAEAQEWQDFLLEDREVVSDE